MANCWKNINLNELDYSEICRLCLSHGGIMSSIFSSPGGVKSISLPSRIMAFASVRMEVGDGLPGLICHSCLFNVERVYEFKMQCEQSDFFLRKCLPDKIVNVNLKEQIENLRNNEHNSNVTIKDEDNSENNIKQEEEFNVSWVDKDSRTSLTDKDDNNEVTDTLATDNNSSSSKESTITSTGRKTSFVKVKPNSPKHYSDFDVDEEEDNNNIEPVVLVVDPNAKALDETISENERSDNEGGTDEFSAPNWLDDGRNREEEEEEVNSGSESAQAPPIHTRTAHHCPSCNKPFYDMQLLERHTMIHTQEPPFPCDYCDELFNDRAGLKSHWRDHAGPRRLSCMACGEAFTDRASLAQHVTLHDEVKPFHCGVCNKAFTYRSDLRKHSVIHTGVRPYVCNICNKSFTRSTNLNKHARAHAGNRPFACSKCPKMFSSRADLTRHAVIHTGEKPYACGVCGLAFNRKDKLTRHVKLHTEDRPHACIECPTSFHRKEELTKHVQFHHFKPDPEFITEVIMEGDEEVESKNVNESDGDFETTFAQGDAENVVVNVDPFHVNNASDQSQYDARAHLLYSCGTCHKRFSDKTYLKKHRLIHSELKPHVCSVCEKGFYRRRELVRHEAVHTGYKPFSCSVCQKPFSRRDKLARHEKTHKDSKFQCSKCNESFNNANSLLQHEIIHNTTSLYPNIYPMAIKAKAYKCFLCPASYARNENLVKHMKTHKSMQYQNKLNNLVNDNLLKDPVDYLSKMNPELNVTIKKTTKNK